MQSLAISRHTVYTAYSIMKQTTTMAQRWLRLRYLKAEFVRVEDSSISTSLLVDCVESTQAASV